jgi:hypothetical protein
MSNNNKPLATLLPIRAEMPGWNEDDEMTAPNHPHADQRNWQPGDTDDGPLISLEDLLAIPRVRGRVLRTLERLRLLTRIPPEMIATALFSHIRIDQVLDVIMYLEEVAGCISKQMQWKCAECGKDIWFEDDTQVTLGQTSKQMRVTRTRKVKRVRHDPRYCSQACRQKAFRKRKRVTAHPPNTAAEPSRPDDLVIVQNELAVTPDPVVGDDLSSARRAAS